MGAEIHGNEPFFSQFVHVNSPGVASSGSHMNPKECFHHVRRGWKPLVRFKELGKLLDGRRGLRVADYDRD